MVGGRIGAGVAVKLLAALLALWAVAPTALLAEHALGAELTLTGADGLFPGDQLQYMSWIRELADQLLASNRFDSAPSERVFVHPTFFLSGVAVELGVSMQVAVLAWKPVAIAVLFAGFAAYVRRHLGLARPAGVVALGLALFLFVPFGLLLDWTGIADGKATDDLTAMGSVIFLSDELWGEPHLAIAAGLMPLFMIVVARLLEPGAETARLGLGSAALIGLLVSWLHPWKGVTLLVVLAGTVAWGRAWRRGAAVTPVAVATAAPLVYYLVLSRADPAWRLAELQSGGSRFPVWVLLGVLGPLALLAIAGAREPANGPAERILRLWPLAALVTYFAVSSGSFHSLETMSLPLAVLCVRGWLALRAPVALAVPVLLLMTVPGPIWELDLIRKAAQRGGQAYYLTGNERRALAHLAIAPGPGAVLARPSLAITVPAFTGRSTWVAHPIWTPNFDRRAASAEALFGGRVDPATARRIVWTSGARFLLADCRPGADIERLLRPVVAAVQRFGCVAVYELRAPLGRS